MTQNSINHIRRQTRSNRKQPSLRVEELGERIVPAVTASFAAGSGTLSVFGDSNANSIAVSRDAAGRILVNGGAVAITGGTPTVANTSLMQVFGLGGNDSLTLSETNGALPRALLFGGEGNDIVTGGSGADQLFGQSGNDVLFGKSGADLLFGGAGNDVLIGGDGDDQMFGESGDDRMVWNPGDDNDLSEGGDGIDTVEVNGGNGAETFSATANGTRVRFDRLEPAPFSIDIGTSEKLIVNANGGNDRFTAGNGLAPLIALTIDGGAGNDSLTGGDGADILLGGDGNDVVTGGRGSDTAFLGAGNDTFVWNPGDGSDAVEGQNGTDRMAFNGANVSEQFTILANGNRTRFFRNVANITMDLNDVEAIDLRTLGGSDAILVDNLAGTDVAAVNINNLSSTGVGDGQADIVTVNGTASADTVSISGSGSNYSVVGLQATINVTGSEGANDGLVINTLAGNDSVNAAALAAGVTALTVDLGDGNDVFVGSAGNDVILGGTGNDSVTGGRGDDVALLGAGDDVFTWNPGDKNDVVEGQVGKDRLIFNGSNVNERVSVSANGGRVLLLRDIANVVMDMNDVEAVTFNAFGGTDSITVDDLSGTDLKEVRVNLAGTTVGAADGKADAIIVNGTAGADNISIRTIGNETVVSGLAAQVRVVGVDPALDILRVNGLAGDDRIDARLLAPGSMQLTIDGGLDSDTVFGSPNKDLVFGGRGNDIAFLAGGDDTFTWNPGDGSDVVEGQGGTDRLVFNGANISEKITLSANGARARLVRDIANINMDLNTLEKVEINALGGADTITVNNLAGTSVKNVAIALAADGQADTVIVNGTDKADRVTARSKGDIFTVTGLAANVRVSGAQQANDKLQVNLLSGADTFNASGMAAGLINLQVDGGAGNDSLTGSAGDDVLDGGADIDFLDGGPGDDVFLNGETVIN